MIHSRSCPSFLLIGGLLATVGAMTPAHADERGDIIRVSNRCDIYGPGFVDVGNGYCSRVGIGGPSGAQSHVRIEQPARAGSEGWTSTGSTSNAALRSESSGMLPGISDAQHLRIQSGVDPYAR